MSYPGHLGLLLHCCLDSSSLPTTAPRLTLSCLQSILPTDSSPNRMKAFFLPWSMWPLQDLDPPAHLYSGRLCFGSLGAHSAFLPWGLCLTWSLYSGELSPSNSQGMLLLHLILPPQVKFPLPYMLCASPLIHFLFWSSPPVLFLSPHPYHVSSMGPGTLGGLLS